LLLLNLFAEVAERFIYIGAVSHLVQDRLGISPKPGQRPEQPAKAKREQAQALNRLGLRMLFLVGNLFRQDMHQPESSDADNGRDYEHDPRNAIGDRVERFTVKERGVGARRQRQGREDNERNETPVMTTTRSCGALDDYVRCLTLHDSYYFFLPLYKLANSFCRDARVAAVGLPGLCFPNA